MWFTTRNPLQPRRLRRIRLNSSKLLPHLTATTSYDRLGQSSARCTDFIDRARITQYIRLGLMRPHTASPLEHKKPGIVAVFVSTIRLPSPTHRASVRRSSAHIAHCPILHRPSPGHTPHLDLRRLLLVRVLVPATLLRRDGPSSCGGRKEICGQSLQGGRRERHHGARPRSLAASHRFRRVCLRLPYLGLIRIGERMSHNRVQPCLLCGFV